MAPKTGQPAATSGAAAAQVQQQMLDMLTHVVRKVDTLEQKVDSTAARAAATNAVSAKANGIKSDGVRQQAGNYLLLHGNAVATGELAREAAGLVAKKDFAGAEQRLSALATEIERGTLLARALIEGCALVDTAGGGGPDAWALLESAADVVQSRAAQPVKEAEEALAKELPRLEKSARELGRERARKAKPSGGARAYNNSGGRAQQQPYARRGRDAHDGARDRASSRSRSRSRSRSPAQSRFSQRSYSKGGSRGAPSRRY